MGHQVNFYMLSEDLQNFEMAIRERGPVGFIPYQLANPELEHLSTLVVPEMGRTWLSLYLIREADLPGVVTQFVEGQNYWTINELRSPVVEFSRSYYNGQMIRRGRLYFQTGYYDAEGRWLSKPKEFIRWADGLLNLIRRDYKRDPKTGFYVGSQAWNWVSEGKIHLNPL